MDELPRMVLRRSSLPALLALTFCGAAVGALLLALTEPDRGWGGIPLLWGLLVVALGGTVIAAWRLFAPRFQIVLEPEGIRDREWGDRVPWQQIERIRMAPAAKGAPPRVLLQLTSDTPNQAVAREVSVAGISPDPEWALKNMLLYWRRYKEDA